jgi:hypothetical protein
MNRSTALLGLLLAAAPFAGCNRGEKPAAPERAPAPTPASRPSSPDTTVGHEAAKVDTSAADTSADLLLYNDPIFPDGAGVMLLPVRLDEGDDDASSEETVTDRVSSSMRGGASIREMPKNIANIIIVDRVTNASRALLDRPALIARFELIPGSGGAKGVTKGSIIYAIVDRDTDGDSSLTDDDEVDCYLSDAAGNGLRRITAEGISLRTWYVEGSTIYLRVLPDLNHDGLFDEDDGNEQILRFDIGGEGPASRVVSDSVVAATIAIAKKPVSGNAKF